jgi:hypothetical protein
MTYGGGGEARRRVEAFVVASQAAQPSTVEVDGPLWGETHAEDPAMLWSLLQPSLKAMQRSPRFRACFGAAAVAERAASQPVLAPVIALAQRLAHSGRRVRCENVAVANLLRVAQLDAWDRSDPRSAVEYWLDEARIWRDGRFGDSIGRCRRCGPRSGCVGSMPKLLASWRQVWRGWMDPGRRMPT